MLRPALVLHATILSLQILASPIVLAIEPWSENPWFWSHQGQPLMLMGGSDDDNLFQWPEDKLIPQLDRIAAAGGNVVRNTMSDRKDAGFEVYPFQQLDDGSYDLRQFNEEYWIRFDRFLRETAKRKIFVQIEVWDRFDYTDNRANDPQRWEKHPYNPPNNINYTAEETGLRNRYEAHPGKNEQPFFFSTPEQRNIVPLLVIQNSFVNKLLDISLQYDHVMYCIDNETTADFAWAKYWTNFIRTRADREQKRIAITEMWDDWNLRAERHRQTFDHPELFQFVDVSQNNHNSGQVHWDNFIYVRELLSSSPRPINTTKTYGSDGNKFGHRDQDAIERFWRHLLAGAASIRFHRPDSGLGINDKAVACIKAARRVEASVPFWNLLPANELLRNRDDNEAYAASTTNNSTIVVYFPAAMPQSQDKSALDLDRAVDLSIPDKEATWQALWIDIDTGKSAQPETLDGLHLVAPTAANWVAVLRRSDRPMLDGELVTVGDKQAFIFLPETAKSSTPQPWILYSPTLFPNYPDEHERWMHEQFLEAGIAVAGIDVGEAYGSPSGNQSLDALFNYLVAERNFATKPVVLGRSRGGLWSSSWAAQQPERVAAIAGIYPVFDLRSYPGIENAADAYGLSPAELTKQLDMLNPISSAKALAKAAIPIYIIHGTQDSVVPIESNSQALQQLYNNEGNQTQFQLNAIEGQGHNYWPGFFRCQELIDFVIGHAVHKGNR